MGTDIDSLQIRINAQATKANDAIDRLVAKLDRLTTSLSRIDGSKLNGLAGSVSQLGTAMQTMNAVNSDNFNKLANGINKLSKSASSFGAINTIKFSILSSSLSRLANSTQGFDNVNVSGISRLSNSISRFSSIDVSSLISVTSALPSIVQSFNGMGFVSANAVEVGNLANNISKLGNKSVQTAITNIPQLATAMKQLMKELSTAPKVSQNLIDMINALAKLSRTGASSGRAAQSLSAAFTGVYKTSGFAVSGIKKINSHLVGLLRSIAPVVGFVKLLDFGKQSMEISSDLTEVQNVVDATFGDYKQKIEDLSAVSIPELGMSEISVKQIGSRFQAMGTAMGFTKDKMSDMSVELTRLTGDMASFYNASQEDVGKALQSIFTGETEPMRKYGIDLTNATIQQYALNQGITTSINKMTQLEKAQLRYNYVIAQTGAAQGDFIRTQDTWANQVRILNENLKQLASIIGGTLINAFKPFVQVLNNAMGYITTFAQTVSNALGKIFGWKYEVGGGITNDLESGASASDDIASSMGDAAKNAQKTRDYTLGIDELHVTNSNQNGSGSDSGIGTTGNSGMSSGEWVQQESMLKAFESELDTLYKLGTHIGQSLTEAMDNIDWNKAFEKAKGFGLGLADFLNGLISPELFGSVGTTVSNSLNTAIYTALSFGETFDFYDFGVSIATGINNFFDTYDFASLANTLNAWAMGILDSAIAALEKTDWEYVGEKIGELLKEIDFVDIGKEIAILLWDEIKAGWGVIKGTFDVAPIEAAIISLLTLPAIVNFGSKIGTFIVTPIVNTWGIIEPILSTAVSMISPITLAVAALTAGLGIAYAKNEEVRESFANATQEIQNGLQPALEFMTNTVLPGLQDGWGGLKDILSPFADFLATVFADVWQEMINPALSYLGNTIIPLVTNTFKNLWNNVLVPLANFMSSVLKPVINLVSQVLTVLWKNVVLPLATAIRTNLEKAFSGLIEVFNALVIPITNAVISTFQFLWNNVFVPIASYLLDKFKPTFENVFSIIKGLIDGLSTAFGGFIDFISGVFSANWEKAWDGIKDVFKGVFNTIITIAEGTINQIINGINWFLDGFDDIVSGIGGVIGLDIHIPKLSNIELPRFELGGFPEDGLFFANHTELVGQFSNGKTAVANNDQIIAGIQQGVYEANSEQNALIQEMIGLLQDIRAKDTTIKMNGREVGKGMSASSRRQGYTLRTVY